MGIKPRALFSRQSHDKFLSVMALLLLVITVFVLLVYWGLGYGTFSDSLSMAFLWVLGFLYILLPLFYGMYLVFHYHLSSPFSIFLLILTRYLRTWYEIITWLLIMPVILLEMVGTVISLFAFILGITVAVFEFTKSFQRGLSESSLLTIGVSLGVAFSGLIVLYISYHYRKENVSSWERLFVFLLSKLDSGLLALEKRALRDSG